MLVYLFFSEISVADGNAFKLKFTNFLFITKHCAVAIITKALMNMTVQKNCAT